MCCVAAACDSSPIQTPNKFILTLNEELTVLFHPMLKNVKGLLILESAQSYELDNCSCAGLSYNDLARHR